MREGGGDGKGAPSSSFGIKPVVCVRMGEEEEEEEGTLPFFGGLALASPSIAESSCSQLSVQSGVSSVCVCLLLLCLESEERGAWWW